MAKLSAHGKEIGRVTFTTFAKAYMADGAILKNSGDGWKRYAKVKDGITPQQAYERQLRAQEEFLAARPCMAAYRKELHAMAGLGKAWKLHTAIQLLGDDVDGIWSEACDGYGDNVHADVDDVANLARLYSAAMEEQAELRDPTNCLN